MIIELTLEEALENPETSRATLAALSAFREVCGNYDCQLPTGEVVAGENLGFPFDISKDGVTYRTMITYVTNH